MARTRTRGVWALALAAGLAASVWSPVAHGSDRYWINSAGGAYNDTNNWLDGLAPNHMFIANFDIAGVFTVGFPGNFSAARYRQRAGDITFDFGGMVYSAVATSPSSESNAAIGRLSGDDATMRLTNGRFESIRSSIGEGAGSVGRVVAVGDGGGISGAPRWYGSGTLFVGDAGDGTLEVTNSALVRHNTVQVGYLTGSTGTVIVTGAGSELTSAQDIFTYKPMWLGVNGVGQMEVNAGATVRSTELNIAGNASSSTSTMTVDGGRVYPTTLTCGWSGEGEMEILAGGLVQPSSATYIGRLATGVGTVVVSGANARLLSNPGIFVGDAGEGHVLIDQDGLVSHTGGGALGSIADDAGSLGSVVVRGSGAEWRGGNNAVYVGRRGEGHFTAEKGAFVNSGSVRVGDEAGSIGVATATGAQTLWQSSSVFYAGLAGEGTLLVEDEATLNASGLQIGVSSTAFGQAMVAGDAVVTLSMTGGGALDIGKSSGWGTLRIEKGGVVQTPGAGLIGSSGGAGQVEVQGAGSLLSLGGNLVMGAGVGASASVAVWDGGEVVCRLLSVSAGMIVEVSGPGSKLTTTQQGVDNAGFLFVDNGAQVETQTATLYTGSTLQGRMGVITGALVNDGEVHPGMQMLPPADQVSTLFVDGDYTQQAAGSLHIDLSNLGSGAPNDALDVGGVATLGGSLVVSVVDDPPPAARSVFDPPRTTEFEIVTATGGVAGAFSSESLPALPGSKYIEVVYEADRVLLVVQSTCPADLNNDGVVDGTDLGQFLLAWGQAGGPADLDASGGVDGTDLGLLLLAWGACP